MSLIQGTTIESVLEEFLFAPIRYPEFLPTLLPIILGAVVIELYFGKHKSEDLGWNTAVGNAIIWTTTGITLLITSDPTGSARYAAYFLILIGGFIGYMNFFHKWSAEIAFFISSAGIIYSLAYVTVVVVKTGMTVDETVLKASAVFIIGVNIVFKIIQAFQRPAQDEIGFS